MPKSTEVNLNPKQKAFCREFTIDFNGTQAAKRAGYSKRTSNEIAAQLLAKLSIQNEIKRLTDLAAKRNDLTVDRVIQELARIGFIDARKFFDDDGSIKDIKDLSDEEAAVLSSIEIDEIYAGFGENRTNIGQSKKIKFWDKKGSLELLGKHLGIFEKDNQQQNKVLVNIPIIDWIKNKDATGETPAE